MIFSGNWYGPYWFDERVRTTGSPCVSWYAMAIRSEPALAAEYGERGDSGSDSENEPSSIDPYTSSVEMCRKRSTPIWAATSHMTFVPVQLVRTNTSGS